ncbi:MAG: hypothetical protein ACTHU0_18200 [Kofleriaceae bacterium]
MNEIAALRDMAPRLRRWCVVLAFALAGCSVVKTSAGTTGTGAPTRATTAAPSATSATTTRTQSATPAATTDRIEPAPRIAGAIVRAQLQSLLGMTPEQAKAALASYGHIAEVTVKPASEFYERCGDNRVCAFSAAESGIDVHDPITLYINPGISISAPPPP